MTKGKPKVKHNWPALEKEWLKSGCIDLREFAEKKGISYSMLRREAGERQWRKKVAEVEQKTLALAAEKTAEQSAEVIAKYRAKKVKVGLDLQEEALRSPFLVNVNNALLALKTGIELEGEGIGDTEKRQLLNLTQNNQTIIFNEAVEAIENDSELRRDIEKVLRKRLSL